MSSFPFSPPRTGRTISVKGPLVTIFDATSPASPYRGASTVVPAGATASPRNLLNAFVSIGMSDGGSRSGDSSRSRSGSIIGSPALLSPSCARSDEATAVSTFEIYKDDANDAFDSADLSSASEDDDPKENEQPPSTFLAHRVHAQLIPIPSAAIGSASPPIVSPLSPSILVSANSPSHSGLPEALTTPPSSSTIQASSRFTEGFSHFESKSPRLAGDLLPGFAFSPKKRSSIDERATVDSIDRERKRRRSEAVFE